MDEEMGVKKDKYILHLPSWYPNDNNKFEGDFIQRHILALSDSDYSHVALFVVAGNKSNRVEKSYYSGKIREKIIYFKKSFFLLDIFRKLNIYIREFNELKAKKGLPLLIHVHVTLFAGIIAYVLNIKYKIPHIISEHSSIFIDDTTLNFKRIRFFLIKRIIKSAKYVLPVSKSLQNAMTSKGIVSSFIVMPNIVSDTFYQIKSIPNSGVKKFLHVSTLEDSVKNISGILRAFEIVENQGYDFKLTFIGNDNINWLKDKVRGISFQYKINIIGPVSYNEIPTIMNEHDVFVLFSNYETFSCVTAEAQAVGIPVVSSDIGAISEIIDHERKGVLIPIGNVERLGDTLCKIINGNLSFDTSRIRKDAYLRYSTSSYSKRINQIYRQLDD